MGTSTSSKGPGSGIPLDPPWLQPSTQEVDAQPQLAPPKRFSNARRCLTEYIRTGDSQSLGRAIGHYSRTGMGGAKKLARRMQATASSANSIYNFFREVREGTDASLRAWIDTLRNHQVPTTDLVNHFVEKVLPLKGTLDEESCRASMDMALTELIASNENIDLFQLNDGEIWQLITLFVRNEACQRLNSDLGRKFEEVAIAPMEIVTRQETMRLYLLGELDAQIISAREMNEDQATENVDEIIRVAVENTFSVFEEML